MRFRDIPQFISDGSYQVNVSWEYMFGCPLKLGIVILYVLMDFSELQQFKGL